MGSVRRHHQAERGQHVSRLRRRTRGVPKGDQSEQHRRCQYGGDQVRDDCPVLPGQASLMPTMRRVLLVAGVLLLTLLASACSSSGGSGNVSRAQGGRELQQTRLSIDRTLDLIKNGQAEQAFAEAKN